MNIQLHQNARTTPAMRLELQAQPQSVSNRALAEVYQLNRHTVAKWRQREMLRTVPSGSRPHPQVRVVAALRETLLLPLDDLLAVTRVFIPRSRARIWIVVCAATGFLTSRR